MILCENKKPHKIAVWFLIFTILPIFGFLLYFLFGAGVTFKTKKILKLQKKENLISKASFRKNLVEIQNSNLEFKNLITFNLINNNSPLLKCDNLKIFDNGIDYFKDLKTEILNAKHSIYFYSYIFASDIIGNEIVSLLQTKQMSGVQVVLMFDSFGSRKTDKKIFEDLVRSGAQVLEFFPPLFKLKFLQLKVNFRNHRKIVIIDNFITYLGGINVRDDHLGGNEKIAPWRDTQIKFAGSATLDALKIFIKDCAISTKKQSDFKNEIKTLKNENTLIQILKSSPLQTSPKIEEGLIFAINSSKKEVVLQTPYLILDSCFVNAIKLKAQSGVKVKIFIPKLKDNFLVYNATLFNAKKLLNIGAEIYMFNGFIHSKTALIDDKVFVVGSPNLDLRSFNLNFEISAFLYDNFACLNYKKILKKDFENSEKLKPEYYKKLPIYRKLAISFSQLFFPFL